MLNKYFLFVLLAVILALPAYAQTEQVKQYIDEARKTAFPGWIRIMQRADSLATAVGDSAGLAAVYNQMGNSYYSKDADKCIQYLQKAYDLYTQLGNKNRAAFCLQNIAFAYQERKDNVMEARKFTERAIEARTEMKDTLQLANMCKYMAFLEGSLHNFKEGKKYARQAILLYSLKKADMGVAVSYRDLATVFEQEHAYDSSAAYLLMAKAIWTGKKPADTFRIFDINNILLRVYTAMKQLDNAENVFSENSRMITSRDIHDDQRLDYYKYSSDYYTRRKDDTAAKEYAEKYKALKEASR